MVSSKDSEALIEAAKAGDYSAFEQLIAKDQTRLRGLIATRLHARIALDVELDDVYQESLLRAFSSVTRFEWRGEDSFLRWVGGIAENIILELARKRHLERKRPLEGDAPSPVSSPSRLLRRDERFDRLEEALQKLRPEHREVILLVRVEGQTFQNTAQRMGRSPDAVKQLLYRALKQLKSAFGDTESFQLPGRTLRGSEEEGSE
jgi:RNA polymerase sigma-70 factor (ECF subfamily)